MSAVAEHEIVFLKPAKVTLGVKNLKSQLDHIMDRALGGGRKKGGWSARVMSPGWQFPNKNDDDGGYTYACTIKFACKPKRERSAESIAKDFATIVKVVTAAGNSAKWNVAMIDGGEDETSSPTDRGKASVSMGYADVVVPANWKSYFSHLYSRQNQIDLVMSCIQAGIDSGWKNRFHCALIGDPASGKTELCQCIKEMLGPESVLEYDATATTQAGAINDIKNREYLPRIMLIEEAEKTDENSLRWLLGVMDIRAEIRKTTYRESIQRDTHMLVIATVNDYKMFCGVMSGALASRFCYHVECPRPDRKILSKILTREIKKIDGNPRWIEPALDYADECGVHDPRRIIAVCLCGKDGLLDGSYQAKLKACERPDPAFRILRGPSDGAA